MSAAAVRVGVRADHLAKRDVSESSYLRMVFERLTERPGSIRAYGVILIKVEQSFSSLINIEYSFSFSIIVIP